MHLTCWQWQIWLDQILLIMWESIWDSNLLSCTMILTTSSPQQHPLISNLSLIWLTDYLKVLRRYTNLTWVMFFNLKLLATSSKTKSFDMLTAWSCREYQKFPTDTINLCRYCCYSSWGYGSNGVNLQNLIIPCWQNHQVVQVTAKFVQCSINFLLLSNICCVSVKTLSCEILFDTESFSDSIIKGAITYIKFR